jgi:transposase-like protein
MSDEEAREAFRLIRWADTNGEAYCPKCGCLTITYLPSYRRWQCKGCRHQFTVTSGTIFANRKMPVRDILLAIAIFVNGAKGHSALQLSRDLDCQYKTAFVLAHKIREALAAEQEGATVGGEGKSVEIDGAYFGGYVKPANYKEHRRDLRKAANQTGKRRCVVIMRERKGRSLPFVFKSEDASLPMIRERVQLGTTIYADDASHWHTLNARYLTKQVDHSVCYSDGEANSNLAESFFSRLRRAEIGIHHHVAGPYLASYASEMSWREDHRRVSNGEQYLIAARAIGRHPVSQQWKGYWQRGEAWKTSTH